MGSDYVKGAAPADADGDAVPASPLPTSAPFPKAAALLPDLAPVGAGDLSPARDAPGPSTEPATSPRDDDGASRPPPHPPAPRYVSPEQPERVTAVFAALRQCAWACGGERLVNAVELTTSPTLDAGLDAGV